jgi:hypothetical protein
MSQTARWQPQMWISLSSALIALCALTFAIYQSLLQRQFLRLSVRPHMIISFNYDNDGAGFMFGNTGMGYGTIKTFEVLVDGRPQPNWQEVCRTLGFASSPAFEFLVPYPEEVLKPDSVHRSFWMPYGPEAEELKLKKERIFVKVCYCSVFDECWKVDSRSGLPERVNQCPKPDIAFTAPPL